MPVTMTPRPASSAPDQPFGGASVIEVAMHVVRMGMNDDEGMNDDLQREAIVWWVDAISVSSPIATMYVRLGD